MGISFFQVENNNNDKKNKKYTDIRHAKRKRMKRRLHDSKRKFIIFKKCTKNAFLIPEDAQCEM